MGGKPCNTGLVLGPWGAGADVVSSADRKRRREPVQLHILFPTWAKDEECEEEARPAGEEEAKSRLTVRAAADVEEVPARKAQVAGDGGSGAKKKLRLSKDQSSLLEDSFRVHNTLTSTQKQELAARLNLRPRQVEVWFQNRRARTKLKQTEEDCEFLKKCCESLSDENLRLKKELQELRLMNRAWPFHVHLSKPAALVMCPSCERQECLRRRDAQLALQLRNQGRLYGVLS